MNLESLPNELLIYIFELLDSIQVLRDFHGLNIRFNKLIFAYFEIYSLNFRPIQKHDFDVFCQQHLPSILNRIHSLYLSDDDDTPNLSSIFFSQSFNLSQFINLHSLSLFAIHSFSNLSQLIFNCHSLPHLTHLNLIQCGYYLKKNDLFNLTDHIWSLSKLIHCTFDCFSIGRTSFPQMNSISFTMEYLSMKNIHCDLYDLSHLIHHTPNLKELHQNIECNFENEPLHILFLSLTSLNLKFEGSEYSIKNLLQKLNNLTSLKLELSDICLYGFEWEEILLNHLTDLKTFHFKVNFEVSQEKQIDESIDSFRSSFWINERQWFVRCDWYFSNGVIYTLPYAFEEFIYSYPYQTKSTCANNDDYWLYNNVKKIVFKSNFYQYPARFLNVRHLDLYGSLNENILSALLTLNRLNSIDTIIHFGLSVSLFENFINQAPNLHTLRLKYFNELPVEIFRISTKSIQCIDLIGGSAYHARYLDMTECKTLFDSSLVQQCRSLLINVRDRLDIVESIKRIPNLQSLFVRCYDEESNEELHKWIQDQIPKTCCMSRDEKDKSIIRLWLNK